MAKLGAKGKSAKGGGPSSATKVTAAQLAAAGVDFLTIGQYLQPTRKHAPIDRFWTPDEFKALEAIAYAKGFLMVSASPLTRSSHHAGEDFARLRAAREAQVRSAPAATV